MAVQSALMIYGGWDGHQPEACVMRLAPYLESIGFNVTLADDLAIFDEPEFLHAQDLIVPCWTMGVLSESQEANLVATIAAGTGLAGWHGGLCDAFRGNTDYQFMTGGQFVAHPGNTTSYTVKLMRPHDPIFAGLTDFTVYSEQYFMHVDPSNEVLATTTFDGSVHEWIAGVEMPVIWKRRHGAGRVFYSALGHVASEFDHEAVFAITTRGMRWAARGST